MKRRRYIPYIFAIAGAAVYLSLIFNDNVWLDEAFSASIIRCDLFEMAQRTFADTLPPFYNFSAWLFTHIFGFSTPILKLYSVLPMFILMLIAAHFIPEISSERAACLYIAFLTAMPHFLEHGTEIRMYSWAVLFASTTAIAALCLMKGIPHAGIMLTAGTVLGAYTHQYALIAEAFVWLMLLVFAIRQKQAFLWLRSAGLCVALYIPCAVLTVFQMKSATSYFSASAPSLDKLAASFRYPFVTDLTPVSALLLCFFLILLAYAFTKRQAAAAYYMLICPAVVLMSFGIMAGTGSTFFSSRYLLPSQGILWLGAALSLDLMLSENRYVMAVAAPLITACLVLIYIKMYGTEYVDMTEFSSFIRSTDEDDGYVMYEDFPEIEICLGYYAPWLKKYSMEDIKDVSGDKYVFVNGTVHTDEVGEIKNENFDISYIGDLTFDRYTFKAYELTEGADR